MKKIALILFLSLGINIAFAADNETPDFQTTKVLAEQGDAQAQNNLGVMYQYGEGIKQDKFEAVKWYHLAAEQGHASAQFNLGLMYFKGQGVNQDDVEAAKWYRLAAEQGISYAQFNLGLMYSLGKGVKQDDVEAVKWFGKACDNGSNRGCEQYKRLNEAGY